MFVVNIYEGVNPRVGIVSHGMADEEAEVRRTIAASIFSDLSELRDEKD